MNNKKVDLLHGPIGKNLIIFCIPIFVGLIFQNLYNTVDSVVVGNYVSANALAAVTSCGVITNLFINFFTGMGSGASVLFSRFYAEKNDSRLHDSVHTAILFTIILSVTMSLVIIVIAPQFLQLVNCPQDVFDEALKYVRIFMIGTIFTALYNIGSGVLRSVGDSTTPFYALVIASCTNIVLDFVFVKYLQMGVSGVAVATIISQGISSSIILSKMMKTSDAYRLIIKDLRIDPGLLKEVAILGLPAGIQVMIQSVSNIFVQRYINSFGAYAMAGIGSAMKIDAFARMVPQAVGLGITTYVSQNNAVKQYERTDQGVKFSVILCGVFVAITSLPIYFFAPQIMTIFTSDTSVVTFGTGMLRTIMPLYEFMGMMNLFQGIVRGYGKSMQVMWMSLLGMVALRQAYLALALSLSHDIQVVYWNYPICWAFVTIITIIYYFQIKKKRDWHKTPDEA